MDLKLSIVFVALIIINLCEASVSYKGYKVYSVVPKTDVQLQYLIDLQDYKYDFWSTSFIVGNDVRIMVSPSEDGEFKQYMKNIDLMPEVSVDDVQELIDAQLVPAAVPRSSLGSMSWDRYHRLETIYEWLDELVVMYPNVVSTVEIGRSHLGRPIRGVIIDFKGEERGERPLAAMIEGGIHSREWISPATVTWIIKEFLTSQDSDVRFLAETFVWHIFPVINPDGYDYTFTNDRMWRKNRNPDNFANNCTSPDMGNGIDLNRNFDFVWMTTGASQDPCTEVYAGPTPTSEAEAQAISTYVMRVKGNSNMIYYFAFHSYSQMILVPYSHTDGFEVLQSGNYADMYEIAIRGADKLTARHGTPYTVGTSAVILYPTSGGSFDWVKGVAEIPIVYLFELRDVGPYGFLLPTNQIIPNNEEIIDCLVEMDKTTRELRYYSGTVNMYRSIMSVITSAVFLAVFK